MLGLTHRRLSVLRLAFCAATMATTTTATGTASGDDEIHFSQHIRPILSENCFHCHGPDDDAREADLRLDTESGAHDYAIVPGNAEDSEVFSRITSEDPDTVMPPTDSGRSLTDEQIDSIRQWIDQGAKYESHWSFVPVRKPDLPQSGGERETRQVIDRFVRSRLQAAGKEDKRVYRPAAPARQETLIRRLTFTLTGLPPTLEEIDVFLTDRAPGAYARLVDGLLRRESYGERMAADWLDVARYSDTYGYQVDRDRFVWPWRDWVIKSFNDNMPYDQFVTEQIAGDLLPGATRDQILATTFNRLHPQKVEGGSVPEEFRIEYVADRTQTFGTALMGLTLECCRCHAHKFDPIQHHEYYRLSAFFDNIDEAGLYSFYTNSVPTPTLSLPTASEEELLLSRGQAVAEAERNLRSCLKERQSAARQRIMLRGDKFMERDARITGNDDIQDPVTFADGAHESGELPSCELGDFFAAPLWTDDFEEVTPGPNRIIEGRTGKAVLLTGDDPIKTTVGNFRRFEPFSVSLWIQVPKVLERAVVFHRSRAWTDAASRGYQLLIENGQLSWSLIHFWPGNAIRIRTTSQVPTGQWLHVTVTNDGSSRGAGVRIFLNGTAADTEVVRDSLTKEIIGGGKEGDTLTIGERYRDRGFTGGLVDQFRVFDRELTSLEIARLAQPNETLDWLLKPSTQWTPAQHDVVIDHYLHRHDPVIAERMTQLKHAREALCEVQDGTSEIMVMRELPSPRPSYRLERGSYASRGERVQPDTPAALIPFPPGTPRNRLGLAKWLTDRQHPLTSRVAVNRLWQLCFGVGLVRTPEDFGSQGDRPTHGDLLDWLAVDFIESGWDVKRMLKQIVTSETYRQSSQHSSASLHDADPQDRLLARFPAHRLSAEMLRDNALAVSGRLVSRIGGPPAKPYEIEASFKPQDRDKDEGLYRRSLYTYWKRTSPAPAMMTLDAAKRDVCRVRRERTSSPLQALVLLNGPQYVEAARGLAQRLMARHATDIDAILRDAFRILTSETPDDNMLNVLQELYQKQLAYFQEDDQRTASFLSVGDDPVDRSLEQEELAAATVTVGVLFNFDLSVMSR